MLIVALVMAVIGLAALVTAVITNNQVIAWVCIGASAFGVVLLIVDAIRERQRRDGTSKAAAGADEPTEDEYDEDYPDEKTGEKPETEAVERGDLATESDKKTD